MPKPWHPSARWFAAWMLAWLAATLVACALLVRADIAARREAFQNDARTAHRLLGQRAAQHEAILSTLVLLDSGASDDDAARRLSALYPQIQRVWRRAPGQVWPDADWVRAEAASRAARRPVLAGVAVSAGRFDLLLAGEPSSYALRIETAAWVPWADWPFDRDGAVKADLVLDDQLLPLQPGRRASGWHGGVTPGFRFDKALDAPSQPWTLRLQRNTGPADWPWIRLLAVAGLLAAVLAALAALQRQREARRRAEQLLRLARTARLGTLGELAAGLAHELNQPLTAVLASTQAARRMLDDDPPPDGAPPGPLREALTHASQQARRAADVVARLRRLIDRAEPGQALRDVPLRDAVREALQLLQPEWQRLGLQPQLGGEAVTVRADPVALGQVLHNLLSNALQAMATVPAAQRRLALTTGVDGRSGVLVLRDGGPGLPPEVMDHLFEPFVSSRSGGLGLGLSLCHSLVSAMGGQLTAQNERPHGAQFRVELPLGTP